MKIFFRALREKIERQPDRNSDQRFWARFEREFGASERGKSLFWGRRWSAAALTALMLTFFSWKILDRSARNQEEQHAAAQMFLQQDMFEELDMHTELDVDELDDADWNILLGEEGGREG